MLIGLLSASGSPGVTATTCALGMNWHRPSIIVDADPTGASGMLAGLLQGQREPQGGILDLAWAQREGHLAESLPRALMAVDEARPDGCRLLTGAEGPAQARGLLDTWVPVAGALKGLELSGQDALADLGRLGLEGFAWPLANQADILLMVVRAELPAIQAARQWLATLHDSASPSVLGRLNVALVAGPYSARECAKALGAPVIAELPHAPREAEVYGHGRRPGRGFARSAYMRGVNALALKTWQWVEADRSRLAPEGGAHHGAA